MQMTLLCWASHIGWLCRMGCSGCCVLCRVVLSLLACVMDYDMVCMFFVVPCWYERQAGQACLDAKRA
jgi:hypothetical protein